MAETLDAFVERFSRNVECFYHENETRRWTLKKREDDRRTHMGAFGWVSERVKLGSFAVTTDEELVDAQAIADADKRKLRGNWEKTSLTYYVKRGSSGPDYRKAVRALRIARNNKP